MSGALSGILGSLMGGGTSANAITGLLTQLMSPSPNAPGGGIAGILQQLEAAGMGNQVKSWVGTGENIPVAPEQLSSAFTPQQLETWAAQAGTTPDKLLPVLAAALPHAVDHATPNGQMPPEGSPPPDLSALLGRLMGR